jgi:phosphoglycolate phosphatase
LKFDNIRVVIWDWNGTLLNDVEYCLNILNNLLIINQLKPLTLEQYRNIFTFPVRDYYQKAGFDFSKKSFEELGKIFMNFYEINKYSLSLFNGVIEVLKYFESIKIEQYLLSAYKQDKLEDFVEFFNIKKYFKKIKGHDNIYATGKTHLGIELRKEINYSREEIVLIGDSLHDYEVAELIDAEAILISNGHQSAEKLRLNSNFVIDDIIKLKDLIKPIISV